MATKLSRARRQAVRGAALAASAAAALAAAPAAGAKAFPTHPFVPGSVVIADSEYPAAGDPAIQLGQPLPEGGNAIADGKYPEVFNNDTVDGSFAVSTPIDLLDVDPFGNLLSKTEVPTDQVTTSFSSKSELAINFSTDGQDLSFSAYNAPPNALDASNSNTPGVIDLTNPDTGAYYRVASNLDSDGNWTFTDTNNYSGDNGRAVMLDNTSGLFYEAGNSNNGSAKKGSALLAELAATGGAQTEVPSSLPQSQQDPGFPNQLGKFSVTELGDPVDKLGKDTNFRGLTIYNGVVYVTKGSGGNGINTVYWVNTDPTNNPCVDGQGLPEKDQPLPTLAGVPYPICILKGFNTQLASVTTNIFPFGIWFANADTLYVADEGDGVITTDPNPYDDAAAQTLAGLQKWEFNGTDWYRVDTFQNGLDLGQPYTVPGYLKGTNSVTGLPWAPATDGLRNISGQVNGDGTATIYAATSTVSGSGDQGADPNAVVKITDELSGTTPGSEQFTTIAPPKSRIVYRGVAVVPSTY